MKVCVCECECMRVCVREIERERERERERGRETDLQTAHTCDSPHENNSKLDTQLLWKAWEHDNST